MTTPPALLEALQKNDLAAAAQALAAGESAVGWQSLVVAIVSRCTVEMIDALLRAGADANEKRSPSSRPTALIVASRMQPYEHPSVAPVVRRLLEAGADPLVVDDEGRSALWWAARKGTAEVLSCLLEAVAHLPRASLEGALEEAVDAWEGEAKLEALLAAGVTPTAEAFVRACASFQETNAQVLLARGVDVNAADARGCTPLHRAVEGGRVALVEALLARGASLTAVTKKSVPDSEIKKGDTPSMVAERQARHWQVSACEGLLRTASNKGWFAMAVPTRHPANLEGALAAALELSALHDPATAEILRSPELRAELIADKRVASVLGSLERAVQVAVRVGASLEPLPPKVHGKWKRLFVDDPEYGRQKSAATLELKQDGTFEAQLSREKLSGTFTHDASAKAPLTFTTPKGGLEAEFDGTELRITRPKNKHEPNPLEVIYFVFGPPK